MQKQAPSFGRILVMVFFALSVFGLLLFLWLSFGGPVPLQAKSYRIQVSVPEATQVTTEADVRIAGVNVGKVKQNKLDPRANRELLTLQIDPKYAPIHTDARAILRLKTIVGETFLQLTTGSPKAPAIPDGGRLANSRVAQGIQFDEVLQALDPKTRLAFRSLQSDYAQAGKGRGQDLNDTLGNLPAFTGDASGLLTVLNQESRSVRRLVSNTGVTFNALTRDDDQLAHLITNAESTFSATAAQNIALEQTFQVFPTFLDETKRTLARTRTFALDADPLLRLLRPDLRAVGPTLQSVRALSPDLRALFLDLPPLEDVSRTGLPALSQTLRGIRPLLGATGPFLGQLNPILQWIGYYNSQVVDFLTLGENAFSGRSNGVFRGPGGSPAQDHNLPQNIVTGNESLATFRKRANNDRGNSYLPPPASFGKPLQAHLALPSFDCNNAPGAPAFSDGKTIPCYQQPLQFQGQNNLFPHINATRYRLGR